MSFCSYIKRRAIVFVPPKINDWNRFEEWVESAVELTKLLEDAEALPGSADNPQSSVTAEWDLNQL